MTLFPNFIVGTRVNFAVSSAAAVVLDGHRIPNLTVTSCFDLFSTSKKKKKSRLFGIAADGYCE
jgi:hypothetical protein